MEWVESSLKKRRWTTRNVGGWWRRELEWSVDQEGGCVHRQPGGLCHLGICTLLALGILFQRIFHIRLFKSATIRVQLTPSYAAAK